MSITAPLPDHLAPDDPNDSRPTDQGGRWPVLTVLNPHEHTPTVVLSLVVSFGAAMVIRTVHDRPLWQAVAVFLLLMAPAVVLMLRVLSHRYDSAIAVAALVLVAQTLHGVEHAYQWVQRHIWNLPLRQSNGLLSPANTEWVHFVWNWLLLISVAYLVIRGMRGWWAFFFVAWVVAHTAEHTYMMIRFLEVGSQLDAFGAGNITAQGLPGIVGRDGWLDRNGSTTAVSFICRLPFATTATRLDAHAAWNVGETLLMLPAIHVFMTRWFARSR